MTTRTIPLLASLLFVVATHASATSTNCPAIFLGGQAPDLLSASFSERAYMLCYNFYSVVASGVTRTPLWSAEHLTSDSVAQARQVTRQDAFHSELAIKPSDRAELADFIGSGDRGHLAPSDDEPDRDSQYQSFTLTNVVVQSADLNRNLWEWIENSTRSLARQDGEVFVVTGPSFVGPRLQAGGRLDVPTHIWKAIYDPKRGASAYITANRPGSAYAVVSIAELSRITRIDPFPALSESLKVSAIALPVPTSYGQTAKGDLVPEQALGLGRADQVSSISGLHIPGGGNLQVRTPDKWVEREVERQAVRAAIHAIVH